MRAPTQEQKESHDAYAVRMPIRIGLGWLPGDVIPGDEARAIPTFRSLLSLNWLVPAPPTASAAPLPVPTAPSPPRRARR